MIRFGVGAVLGSQSLTDAADWLQIPSAATGDGEAHGEFPGRMDNDADQISRLTGDQRHQDAVQFACRSTGD